MKLCEHCKDFAEEKCEMATSTLYIGSSYYDYECKIKYCPNCGNNIQDIKEFLDIK